MYDAFDNRIRADRDLDGDGADDESDVFVWTESQVLLQFSDSDGPQGVEPQRLTNRYLYAEIVDHLIAEEQFELATAPELGASGSSGSASETIWPLQDMLGSVRDVIDGSGALRLHRDFDSFGNVQHEVYYDASGQEVAKGSSGAMDTAYAFTGRFSDSSTTLQYNRARWYDSGTGRWLSQDPIGFAAGDANLYRYVGNQPTTKVDPSGLEEVTIDVITFIPAEWVTLVPGIWLAGDDRGPGDTPDGSFRIKSQITFDTDLIGNALTKSNPGIGQSEIMFGCLLPGIGGEFVSQEFTGTGSASPKQSATGVNGKVELHISNSGNVPRKFVVTAGAPLINYSMTGFAREEGNSIYVEMKYQHDGFPAYEVFANRQPVYCHNPEDEGQTPLSLFGGGEFTGTLWFEVDKRSGKVKSHGTGPRVITIQGAPSSPSEPPPIKIVP